MSIRMQKDAPDIYLSSLLLFTQSKVEELICLLNSHCGVGGKEELVPDKCLWIVDLSSSKAELE
jgi:hypothetical protein